MRKITIDINPQGKVQFEAQGYVGEGCKAATQFLNNAVGAIDSDKPTDEAYQTEQEQQHLQN